jgi:hypothetical protein
MVAWLHVIWRTFALLVRWQDAAPGESGMPLPGFIPGSRTERDSIKCTSPVAF